MARASARGRRNVVALTQAGRVTVARCHELARAAQDAMLEPLTDAERSTLADLLAKLA